MKKKRKPLISPKTLPLLLLLLLFGLLLPQTASAKTTSRTLNGYIQKAKSGRIIIAYNPNQTGVSVYAKASRKSTRYGVLGFGDAVVVNASKLKYNKKYSWLPVYQYGTKNAKGQTVTGYIQLSGVKMVTLNTKKYSSNRTIHNAIKTGMKYLGTTFVLGGSSFTSGIDCSNFVGKCFAAAGKKLVSWNHTSTLENVSRQIFWHKTNTPLTQKELNKMKPGDLLFYLKNDTSGPIDHVAIYIGKGLMINASGHYGENYPSGGICIKRVQYGKRYMVLCKRINGF